jgi:hypothetical protein
MLLQRDVPTNCVELILDLRRARWKMIDIAKALNVPTSTLGKWFYESSKPNIDDGLALLALHRRVTEKRQSEYSEQESASQSDSHARLAQPRREQPMAKRPRMVRQPGDEPQALSGDLAGGESDPDAAIAAAQSGRARKIAKPRPAVPASRVKGDPERPADAAVNASREMSYAAAMTARDARELPRSVLTEKGWVQPLPSEEEIRAAQRSR